MTTAGMLRYTGPARIQPCSNCQSELHQLNRDFEEKPSKPVPEGCIIFCDPCISLSVKRYGHTWTRLLCSFTSQCPRLLFNSIALQLFLLLFRLAGLNRSLFILCMNNPDLDKTVLFACKHVFPCNVPCCSYRKWKISIVCNTYYVPLKGNRNIFFLCALP